MSVNVRNSICGLQAYDMQLPDGTDMEEEDEDDEDDLPEEDRQAHWHANRSPYGDQEDDEEEEEEEEEDGHLDYKDIHARRMHEKYRFHNDMDEEEQESPEHCEDEEGDCEDDEEVEEDEEEEEENDEEEGSSVEEVDELEMGEHRGKGGVQNRGKPKCS